MRKPTYRPRPWALTSGFTCPISKRIEFTAGFTGPPTLAFFTAALETGNATHKPSGTNFQSRTWKIDQRCVRRSRPKPTRCHLDRSVLTTSDNRTFSEPCHDEVGPRSQTRSGPERSRQGARPHVAHCPR